MNFEDIENETLTNIPAGYELIVKDTEGKYIYFTIQGSREIEISRNEIIEIIKNGESLPLLEIRKSVQLN